MVFGKKTFVNTAQFSGRLIGITSLSILSLGLLARPAMAQVALSVGVDEVYDDNIYLEDDLNTDAPVIVTDPGTGLTTVIPKDLDGDKNDDFITNVYAAVSGAVPLSKHLKTGVEAKVGALVFAKEEEESRLTLDSTISIASEKTLLPEPLFFSIASEFRSDSSDIAVAEGSAAEGSQTHEAIVDLGLTKWEFMDRTDLDLYYTFTRHDFLGDFTFGSRSDSPDEVRQEAEGSDYFSNALHGRVNRHMTQQVDAFIAASTDFLTYTDVQSNTVVIDSGTDELDRFDNRYSVGTDYIVNDKVKVGGEVGLDHTHYVNDLSSVDVTFINPDGSQTVETIDRSQNETSLFFAAYADYAPDKSTSVGLRADQESGNNIDGSRIETRSVSLNASRLFGERVQAGLGGRFLQFSEGDNLNDPTNRVEATVSLHYILTPSMTLGVGYSYINQNADSNSENNLITGAGDYDSNRVFISFNAGLVGTKS